MAGHAIFTGGAAGKPLLGVAHALNARCLDARVETLALYSLKFTLQPPSETLAVNHRR